MSDDRPSFHVIVKDNEHAAARGIADGNFVQAYLLVHALTESLLRYFLRKHGKDMRFDDLIQCYKGFLEEQQYPEPTFVKELTEFNRRRNKMVHELWRKGFSFTNSQAEPAARAAIMIYGLFIEWLETFDPSITSIGFEYDGSV